MNSNVLRVAAATACVLGLATGATALRAAAAPQQPDLPEGFVQLIPRGTIPPVIYPVFVAASEADIDDDAFVLGVVIDGESRAFSLELLNHHEIVNDTVGGQAYAAVW